MSKTVEQIDSTSWKVTENFGSYTSVYIVYDDDPTKTDTRKSFEKMSTEELNAVKSLIGAAGPQGTTGGSGAQGAAGVGTKGEQGAAGANGSNGSNGAQGATGATGPGGSNGSNGGTGAQGTQGTTGTTPTISIGQTYSTAGGSAAVQTYVTGNNTELRFFIPTGAQGAAGATGVNGSNGAQGATGATGTSGVNGSNGAQGIQGPAGADGTGGGDGGGGVIGVKTNSEAFSAEIDEEGTAYVGPIGLTTDVRVTDGRSPIILSFTDGILTNIYLDKL